MCLLFIQKILHDSNINTPKILLQDNKAGCFLHIQRAVKQREESAIHSSPQKKCMLWVNTGVAPGMNYRAGHREKDESESRETNADSFQVS